jgi:5,10-methylenetetrahydrofolate reductase
VLLGVWYVTSYRLALHIHNEVPGVVVQDHVQERFRAAGPDASEVGRALVWELMQEARERVAGVYVIPPFKRPEAPLELLD